MSEKEDKDKLNDWLQLLPDELRADVLKDKIKEDGQTERLRIQQDYETKQKDISTDGFHFFRALLVFALLCFIGGSTCVVHKLIESREAPATPR